MRLSEDTKHIMMKRWEAARAPFGRRSSRFSSVLLGVFSSFSADFALRNGSETLQKRLRNARETLGAKAAATYVDYNQSWKV